MDTPQQANAAQMAARKLKGLPKGRGGARRHPVRAEQDVALFAPRPGEGLFGGTVQAEGTFNFAAPAGASNITFPAPTFKSNPEASQEPQDGLYDGDDRGGKRQFGKSSPGQSKSSSLFQTQTPSFGQPQQNSPFATTNPQQPSGGNIFGTTSQGSGFNFNSTSSQAPAHAPSNPFSFGATSQTAPSTPSKALAPSSSFSFGATSQAAPSSPSVNFGSLPGQEHPVSNMFNPTSQPTKPGNINFAFGQSATSSAPMNFGSTASQQKPASFQFGQTSGTSVSAPFGSQLQVTKAPQTNLFGTPQTSQPKPSSNMFASMQHAAPSNPFESLNAPASPAVNGNEHRAQSPAAAGSLFGGLGQQQFPATSNLFGSTSASQNQQQTLAPSNAFSIKGASHQSQQQVPATSNMFGTTSTSQSQQSLPATSNLFGNTTTSQSQQPTPATSNIFADSQSGSGSSTSSNFFGQQDKPTAPTNNLFGGANSKISTSNVFSNLNQPASSTSNLFSSKSSQPAPSSSTFSGQQKQPSPPKDTFPPKELFPQKDLSNSTLNKPVDESVMQPKINGNHSQAPDHQSTSQTSSSSSNLFSQAQSLFSTPSTTPAATNNKPSFVFGSSQSSSSTTAPLSVKPIEAHSTSNHPRLNGTSARLDQPGRNQQLAGDSKHPVNVYAPLDTSSRTAAEFSSVMQITDESIASVVPAHYDGKMRAEFYAAYRLRALNEKMATLFKQINVFADPTPALQFYQEERRIILSMFESSPEISGFHVSNENRENEAPRQFTAGMASTKSQAKRKVNDEDQENENPSKRTRQSEPTKPTSSSANGQVHEPLVAPAPTKPVQNGNGSQLFSRFETVQQTTSPNKPLENGISSNLSRSSEVAQPATPSPTKSKRKAEDFLDQNTVQASPLRAIKTPKPYGGSAAMGSSGSKTSNVFKDILASPSAPATGNSSPEKKIAPLPEAKETAPPKFNPFNALPGTTPKNKSAAPPSFSFTPKNAPPGSPSLAKPAAPPSFSFTPNAAPSTAPSQGKAVQGSPIVFTPKGPQTNPTNFLSQFGSSAAKDKAAAEKDRLKKAILEDWDSDGDETKEEFIANFKAQEAARQKEYEELAKNAKRPKFDPKKGFGYDNNATNAAALKSTPEEKLEEADTGSKTLSGPPIPQESGTSVFSSLNNSGSSTPAAHSPSGSVLGGVAPAKDIKNIFGHLKSLSDRKDDGDDTDDDASDADEDAENRDPSYEPGTDSGSGSGSGAGTPVEETGPGIASAKKAFFASSLSGASTPSLFEKPTSGTSTPGRSLFDRMPKDETWRHSSSEEKENTQPNPFDVKNPFISLNKTTPSDQTWKPDSPIKFGSTNNDKDSAPIVSVTAATPTKTGSPSNIFGIPNTTPAPFSALFSNKGDGKPATNGQFSNLFGSSSTTKSSSATNVGFNFGGSSTPSSLFPSAAGSAATSRATSPGATTDEDTGADADPNAEKHEQIDLTAGGAGEEDEEVVHSVRAKARMFVDKDKEFVVKGTGPLRILKHKETGVARILMRADPSGAVVFNKGILGSVSYKPEAKTVRVLTVGGDGKSLETWLFQVKTEEFARKLAETLEENKADS